MNIANLESVARSGDQYTARYERLVDTTKRVAHPVFTNAPSMTDKVGVSRLVKHIVSVPGTRTETELVSVTKLEARAIVEAAQDTGMFERVERLGNNSWVVRIK